MCTWFLAKDTKGKIPQKIHKISTQKLWMDFNISILQKTTIRGRLKTNNRVKQPMRMLWKIQNYFTFQRKSPLLYQNWGRVTLKTQRVNWIKIVVKDPKSRIYWISKILKAEVLVWLSPLKISKNRIPAIIRWWYRTLALKVSVEMKPHMALTREVLAPNWQASLWLTW